MLVGTVSIKIKGLFGRMTLHYNFETRIVIAQLHVASNKFQLYFNHDKVENG